MGYARRVGAVALGLAISATGLIGIMQVEGQAIVHRDWAKQAKAAPVAVVAAVPEAVVDEAPVVEPIKVRVPAFYGLRLARATARAEAQGLHVRFVDAAGNAVPADGGDFYRVVRQNVRRRTEVDAGGEVILTVRERVASYSDWG